MSEEQPTNPEKPKVDPVEQAAMIINDAHKNFRSITYNIAKRKKNAIARVLEAVLFEPLEQVELHGREEQELFDICQQIMQNKGIVLNYAFEKFKTNKGELNGTEEK